MAGEYDWLNALMVKRGQVQTGTSAPGGVAPPPMAPAPKAKVAPAKKALSQFQPDPKMLAAGKLLKRAVRGAESGAIGRYDLNNLQLSSRYLTPEGKAFFKDAGAVNLDPEDFDTAQAQLLWAMLTPEGRQAIQAAFSGPATAQTAPR